MQNANTHTITSSSNDATLSTNALHVTPLETNVSGGTWRLTTSSEFILPPVWAVKQ